MNVIARLVDNPVLTKEFRVRMRGAKAYWIIAGYLSFLSLVLFFQYLAWWSRMDGGAGMSSGSKIGQDFFYWIAAVQAFFVAFITPAITSGAITIEREQRTLEMLIMTRISRGSIVAGKLMSAVSFIALLLVSSLPLTSICFFLGGVSPEQVAFAYTLLLAGSFIAGSLGLAWSAVAKTTAAAVIFTYVTLVLPPIALITLLALTAISGGINSSGDRLELCAGLAVGMFGISLPVFSSGGATETFLQQWDMRHFYWLTLPVWVGPLLTYSLIGLTLAAVAAVRLETFPERRAGLLRGLTLLFFLVHMFFLFGARFSAHAGAAATTLTLPSPLVEILVYPAILLLVCVPIFATGTIRVSDARQFGRYLARGWTPAGLRRGTLSSGLPFMMLLGAAILGMYWLSFVLVGQPRAVVSGVLTGPFGGAVTPATPAGDVRHIALVLATSIAGLSALGLLASVVTRNRWAALAVLYVFIVAVFVVPLIADSAHHADAPGRAPSLLVNVYYLNPSVAVADISDTQHGMWKDTVLALSPLPVWMVTSALYAAIALAATLASIPFALRIGTGQSLEYEDFGARV